jgi:hypothetical protein
MGARAVKPNGAPQAIAANGDAWIGNDRIAARILAADSGRPVMLLTCRNGADWQSLLTGACLGEVLSSEEGQIPWWESFRWHDVHAQSDKDFAILSLVGTVGTQWRGELILEVQRDTSAMKCQFRLTALRNIRLYGVRLPRLLSESAGKDASALHADGSAFPVVTEEPVLPDDAHVAAGRAGGATFGISWPDAGPFAGGFWSRLPAGDAVSAPVLGAEWREEAGEVILAGASIDVPFRLFSFAPSDSIRDALRFQVP